MALSRQHAGNDSPWKNDVLSLLKEMSTTLKSIQTGVAKITDRVTNIEHKMADMVGIKGAKEVENDLTGVRSCPTNAGGGHTLDEEGVVDSMKRLSVGGAVDQDKELAKQLGRIEQEYLSSELTDVQKAKPELVNYITENLILPALQGHIADKKYRGSSYEFTAVPSSSDFDIQFFLKIPSSKQKKVRVVEIGDPDWRKVEGGPPKLLNSDGYLSPIKARNLITSEIDKALKASNSKITFQDAEAEIRRSTHGPATTLDVRWKGETINMDLVVCLRKIDLENSEYDLVGKPHKSEDDLWRQSYATEELKKLRQYHYHSVRKSTLLRIIKVIKLYHPQLRRFTSYFYKNVLFLLDERNPEADWGKNSLAERFKDMIQLIHEVLDKKSLPLHFNPQVDYLANEKPNSIEAVANHLKSIIKRGAYVNLVKKVPLSC